MAWRCRPGVPSACKTKRHVGEVGPGSTVARVGVLRTWNDRRLVADAHLLSRARTQPHDISALAEAIHADLGQTLVGGAVVGQEDGERVVEPTDLVQRGHDPSNPGSRRSI